MCIYRTSPRQLALDLSHALITVLPREGWVAGIAGLQCVPARPPDVSVFVFVLRDHLLSSAAESGPYGSR